MEIKASASGGAELHIYGDIVSTEWDRWTEEDACPQGITNFLSQIDGNAELTVYINSPGGDATAGVAIHSILKRHSGHTKGVVDALAASAASVILMACDEIVVNSGAQIMIHKPWLYAVGNADEMRKAADYLDTVQKSMAEIYMERAKDGVTEDQINEMMDAETWMNGVEAEKVFDLGVQHAPAAAAYSGGMLANFKHTPAGLVTAKMPEFEDSEREAAEILEDLDLYGT